MTDLLNAILECDLSKLKIFLDHCKNVNYKLPGTDGCTILHILAGMGENSHKEEVISYLLDNAANPNARSNDDLTPVHIAAMWNNHQELEKLIKNGGNPWLVDNENKNAFDMAADHHAYEAYQLLNQYLADNKLNFRKKECDIKLEGLSKNHSLDCSETFLSKNLYYSANENFPVIFSSDDDQASYFYDVSQIMQKNKFMKLVPKEKDDCVETQNYNEVDQSHVIKSIDKSLCDNTVLRFSDEGKSYNCFSDYSRKIKEPNSVNGIFLVENFTSAFSQSCSIHQSLNSTTFIINDLKSCKSSSSCLSSSDSVSEVPKKYFQLTDSEIHNELVSFGEKPGPITEQTRNVYLKHLTKLKNGCAELFSKPEPKYSPEVYLFLEDKLDMNQIQEDVLTLSEEFNDSALKSTFREGRQKSCFNYFLLDPRVTLDLPVRYADLSFEQTFQTFLDAIFYVGKGSKARSYDHLLDAVKACAGLCTNSAKIERILDIWNSGYGVISLHCFNNCIPVEAYTQEACIIEAIGLKNLTNIKGGDYYGQSTKWKRSKKRKAGIHFLNKALHIFLFEGEKQIKPKDLQKK